MNQVQLLVGGVGAVLTLVGVILLPVVALTETAISPAAPIILLITGPGLLFRAVFGTMAGPGL